jgi:hypothetical protein
MNNWTSFHSEHFQAHCKNFVSLTIEIRLALKGPLYRVSLSVPFQKLFEYGMPKILTRESEVKVIELSWQRECDHLLFLSHSDSLIGG